MEHDALDLRRFLRVIADAYQALPVIRRTRSRAACAVYSESPVLLSEEGFDEHTDGVRFLLEVGDDTLLLQLPEAVDGDVTLRRGELLSAIAL